MIEKDMRIELEKLSKEEIIDQYMIRIQTIEKLTKEIDKLESKNN